MLDIGCVFALQSMCQVIGGDCILLSTGVTSCGGTVLLVCIYEEHPSVALSALVDWAILSLTELATGLGAW